LEENYGVKGTKQKGGTSRRKRNSGEERTNISKWRVKRRGRERARKRIVRVAQYGLKVRS